MKTFVWPTGSQNNTRSAFDWNNIDSIWSFEENEKVEEEKEAIDPAVQQCIEYAKTALPAIIYQIKMSSGLSDHEIIVLLKSQLSGIRPIAEASLTNKLNGIIEQTTGYKISNQFDLSDQQMVQAIDLIIEFLNSKL